MIRDGSQVRVTGLRSVFGMGIRVGFWSRDCGRGLGRGLRSGFGVTVGVRFQDVGLGQVSRAGVGVGNRFWVGVGFRDVEVSGHGSGWGFEVGF